MSAELHRLKRQRRPFPIPDSACTIINATGRDFVQYEVQFSLRRSGRGTDVMFIVPAGPLKSFTWNVSYLVEHPLSSFAEARRWAHAYAAGYGQTVVEVVKQRRRPVPGPEGKALRAGACREAWLDSDTPELWAEAMMRCQHPGGYCGADGYCHYGDCDMEMSRIMRT